MSTTVIGLLGTTLDAGFGPKRWERWRPTVDLCRHDTLVVDRLELIHPPAALRLAEQVKEDVLNVSPETTVALTPLRLDNPWDFEEVFSALHELAASYEFDTEASDYLVHVTTGTHVAQICLFLLTESRHFPGRLVQSHPGRRGGPGRYAIIDLDLSRYDRIAARFELEQAESLDFLKSGIATKSPTFNALIERIEQVAVRSREPMLLMGPTGAGKSQLARRIHALKSARRQIDGAFVEVNCATLRGDQAMAALFGHDRGAFTGATRDRPGLLRTADRGILFLDEIGELGLDEQAMLLRAVEEKRFLPVGADHEAQSDFQLIAGTNRDLRAAAVEGEFRDDLLARIDLWTFELPGLAERREDLEPNLDYELAQWTRRTGNRVTLSKDARRRFLAFARSPEATWAGNFRDFNAAVLRMATLAPGGRVTPEVVEEELTRLRATWLPARMLPARSLPSTRRRLDGRRLAGLGADRVEAVLGERGSDLDRFDRVQLEDVLSVVECARSLSEAGRVLFSESRKRRTSVNDADRLRKYLARFDLDFESARRRG